VEVSVQYSGQVGMTGRNINLHLGWIICTY